MWKGFIEQPRSQCHHSQTELLFGALWNWRKHRASAILHGLLQNLNKTVGRLGRDILYPLKQSFLPNMMQSYLQALFSHGNQGTRLNYFWETFNFPSFHPSKTTCHQGTVVLESGETWKDARSWHVHSETQVKPQHLTCGCAAAAGSRKKRGHTGCSHFSVTVNQSLLFSITFKVCRHVFCFFTSSATVSRANDGVKTAYSAWHIK